jgi:hypothetical protein
VDDDESNPHVPKAYHIRSLDHDGAPLPAPWMRSTSAAGEASYSRSRLLPGHARVSDAASSHHARNRLVASSKGCITDEDIPPDSPLRTLYDAPLFRAFVCAVLGETQIYPYADKLSSINLHYAHTGQELGWHFDNSSFAITLLIQKPQAGGVFEYISHLRDADRGDMNYSGVASALDGQTAVQQLAMEPGDLVLFRGRNAMHRVTPTEGPVTRMLVVLAYNSQPGVALSESARMTFYGRL